MNMNNSHEGPLQQRVVPIRTVSDRLLIRIANGVEKGSQVALTGPGSGRASWISMDRFSILQACAWLHYALQGNIIETTWYPQASRPGKFSKSLSPPTIMTPLSPSPSREPSGSRTRLLQIRKSWIASWQLPSCSTISPCSSTMDKLSYSAMQALTWDF